MSIASRYHAVDLAARLAARCKKARKTSRGWLVCCPVHTDTHPSLSILIGPWRITLKCWAGCEQDVIAASFNLTPDELALIAHRSWRSYSPRVPVPTTPKAIPDAPARQAWLRQLWHESKPITLDDPVGRYFLRRGLWQEPIPKALRYHPRLAYKDDDTTRTYHPALLAIIQSIDATPVGMHRIYLTTDGAKADVPHPKKLLVAAPWEGAAVRLGRAGSTLVVAEGVETGLAVRKTAGLPTWSAISAGRFKTLALPETVELVIIAADNDTHGVGQRAARELADRLIHEGRDVKICLPALPGSDWADGAQEVYGG